MLECKWLAGRGRRWDSGRRRWRRGRKGEKWREREEKKSGENTLEGWKKWGWEKSGGKSENGEIECKGRGR